MDDIDRKILTILEKNARISLKRLSEQMFLSSPAIATRIENMENNGVIQGYITQINREAMGYSISAIINVTMIPDKKESFMKFINDSKNVLECYHVSGPYSMVLKVYFKNTAELDAFVSSLQVFGNTLTQIIFSEVIK